MFLEEVQTFGGGSPLAPSTKLRNLAEMEIGNAWLKRYCIILEHRNIKFENGDRSIVYVPILEDLEKQMSQPEILKAVQDNLQVGPTYVYL